MSDTITVAQLPTELLRCNKKLYFQIRNGLPTAQENKELLEADKAVIDTSGVYYWHIIEDVKNRQKLQNILEAIEATPEHTLTVDEFNRLMTD